jgi:hypothetical protein
MKRQIQKVLKRILNGLLKSLLIYYLLLTDEFWIFLYKVFEKLYIFYILKQFINMDEIEKDIKETFEELETIEDFMNFFLQENEDDSIKDKTNEEKSNDDDETDEE